MTRTPLIKYVPKDPAENLRWRLRIRERALTDLHFRHAMIDACFEDVLLFLNGFTWVIEPRAEVKIRPFCTYPHQDPVFVAMDQAIDDSQREQRAIDVLVEKSRAQGGTYGYLWVDLRRWLRDPMFSAGYVTRNEDLVDSATDSSTLFWKLAWAIEMLPWWLRPKGFNMKQHRSLSGHTIINPENGSVLAGYAAGQDVGRGGRASVFTCDEIGAKDFIKGGKDESVIESLHDVTNCLRLVSTFGADSGMFYEACNDPDTNGLHLILDWKDNPEHGKHAYIVNNGHAAAVKWEDQDVVNAYHKADPQLLKKLERKGYQVEGKIRSPWYDMRCLRKGATPRLIARELDRDPRGAVGKVFESDLLDRMKRTCCKDPLWQGVAIFDDETLSLKGLLTQKDGPLKLWFRPGPDNSPPLGPFTVGCDIAIGSSGAYSSNSVASVIDDRTGEQVAEYTIKGVPSIKFGRTVVGLCKWLRNAYLGWEDSGMAGPFAKEIVENICYGRVYYRPVNEIGSHRKTRKAGWWNGSDDDKGDLFEKLALAMEDGRYVPRSEDLVRECGEYEWENGKIIHRPTKNHGATEKAHGDRCIASGVAFLLYSETVDTSDESDSGQVRHVTVPYGSWAWREQREKSSQADFDSPEFGIRDLLIR